MAAAKKKTAAKKTAAKKAPARKPAASTGTPSKLVVKASGKVPETDIEHVVHAAKAIRQSGEEGFVRVGQITLYLTAVTNVAEDAADARKMVTEAYEDGALTAYVRPAASDE